MKKIIIKRKTVLRTIVVLILLSMAFFLKGQELKPNQKIYQDFGTWSLDDGLGNKVAIQAYATVENIKQYPTNSYQKQSLEPYDIQRYELYLTSKSIYQGSLTSTWIYGARVFIDFGDGYGKREMTAEQFPDGFVMSISTTPTLVYWYQIEQVEGLGMYVSWNNAAYETRIRK